MSNDTDLDLIPDVSTWYKDIYGVYHKDIDFNSELRLSALLLMLQETAWNHARVLGLDYHQEAFKTMIWVLSRMRIEIFEKPPIWMEQVHLATSPTGIDRLFALRDFLAMHENGLPFARIASAWIVIDATTRRPIRPQSLLDENNFHFEPSVMPGGTCKLSQSPALEWGEAFKPGYTDIDAHQHVNNVSYAQWCFSTIDAEFFKTHRVVSFDINFLAEVNWGQSIRVGRGAVLPISKNDMDQSSNSETFIQDFAIKKLEGENAALARIGWQSR